MMMNLDYTKRVVMFELIYKGVWFLMGMIHSGADLRRRNPKTEQEG